MYFIVKVGSLVRTNRYPKQNMAYITHRNCRITVFLCALFYIYFL